jgi:DNA primase
MASRIPQAFIDELLDRSDIVDIVDTQVKLKKNGRNYSACCPFHKEKTPSFTVAPDKQFYYCFGCGAGGNAIGFLMALENLSFPEAVQDLARRAGLQVPVKAPLSDASRQSEQIQLERRTQAYALLQESAHWFQQQLRQHPQRREAVDYLKQRGLNGIIAKYFGIGFAPSGWRNLIDQLGQGDSRLQNLIDTGMVIQQPEDKRCYDRFRARIMFPIRDHKGRVIAFGGRVLGDDKPKYLNSPETSVFHKQRALYGLYEARQQNRNLKRLLLVEGYMDVVALFQHGIHYAVATLGTATSAHHLEQIFRQCQEVVFCFDGDAAGQKAAWRALETCLPFMQDGRQARVLLMPQGQDPDSLVRHEGMQAMSARIANATPLSEFLFQQLSLDLNLDNLEHRANLANLASPLIASMPKGVIRQLMYARLAEVTGLEQDTLRQLTAIQDDPRPSTDSSHSSSTAATTALELIHLDAQGYGLNHAPEYSSQAIPNTVKFNQYFKPAYPKQPILNPAQQAMRLLLSHPQLAKPYREVPEFLRQMQLPDALLLVRLLKTINQLEIELKRDLAAVELQVECCQWSEWPHMCKLASLEPLLDESNWKHQMVDILQHLQRYHRDERINLLVQQLQQRTLSSIEKQELQNLLQPGKS